MHTIFGVYAANDLIKQLLKKKNCLPTMFSSLYKSYTVPKIFLKVPRTCQSDQILRIQRCATQITQRTKMDKSRGYCEMLSHLTNLAGT